jgi:hypothetical protein
MRIILDKPSDRLTALGTYIDGKIKRYNLMFAVNGGAFALGKLLRTSDTPNILGGLSLIHIAIGAIAFTFLMWFDIWLWGENMRLGYFSGGDVFQWRGKVILSLLASLLVLGWLLAIFNWQLAAEIFASLLLLGAVLIYQYAKTSNRKADVKPNGASSPAD